MRSPEPSKPYSVIAEQRGGIVLAARTAGCALAVTPLLRWATITHAVRPGRHWRRSCPRCSTPLGPRGDLLALSPVARCGRCKQRLGPPPAAPETAVAPSAALLIWSGLHRLPPV